MITQQKDAGLDSFASLLAHSQGVRVFMNILFKSIFIAMLISVLCSCVPIPLVTDIYEPSANNGKLLDSMCGYNQGPGIWDKLEFKFNKTKLRVRAFDFNDKTIRISVSLFTRGKELTQYKWGSNELILTTNGSRSVISSPQQSDKSIDLTIEDTSSQYFYIDTNKTEEGVFNLRLPQLFLNDKKIDIPIINFKPSTSWYVITLNC